MSLCHIDNDYIERIQVGFIFIVEICRLSMGCFTSVFVSHLCGEKECSLYESVTPNTFFGIITLLINLGAFILLSILFLFELYRENWFIKNFDKDENLPETYLQNVIDSERSERLKQLNKSYVKLSLTTIAIFILNIIISGVFLYNNYRSFSTLTAFVSFTLLLVQKIQYSFYISRLDSKTIISAHSAFMTLPHRFNTIDKDIKQKKIYDSSRIYPKV